MCESQHHLKIKRKRQLDTGKMSLHSTREVVHSPFFFSTLWPLKCAPSPINVWHSVPWSPCFVCKEVLRCIQRPRHGHSQLDSWILFEDLLPIQIWSSQMLHLSGTNQYNSSSVAAGYRTFYHVLITKLSQTQQVSFLSESNISRYLKYWQKTSAVPHFSKVPRSHTPLLRWKPQGSVWQEGR